MSEIFGGREKLSENLTLLKVQLLCMGAQPGAEKMDRKVLSEK